MSEEAGTETNSRSDEPVFAVDGGALVRKIAGDLHTAVRRTTGSTQSQCKNASVALALALGPLGEPVAVCYGTVMQNAFQATTAITVMRPSVKSAGRWRRI